MKTLGLGVVAVVLVGAALMFSGVLTPKEPPKLQLQALLAANGADVTERVEWFVERDGSWMGPDFATQTDAVPGAYSATFQIFGGPDFVAELNVGEGESGTLLANLDATLVEVALPADARAEPVSFRFASAQSMGSQGVKVSEDGYARALVTRDLQDLELEVAGRTLPMTADFAAGAVVSLVLENDAVRASE